MQNKEHEASEERKRRARELEMQRHEMQSFGPRQSGGLGGLGSNFGSSQYQSVHTSPPDVAATSHYNNYKADSAKKYVFHILSYSRPLTTMKGKGMQLGKKASTRLYNALSTEMTPMEDSAPTSPLPASTPETWSSNGIHISFNETTNAKTNRDGGLESMEVQGLLNLHISDSALSHLQLDMHTNESDGTQFKTHPNVDRNLFRDQHKIGFRDSSRPFPLNQQTCVLRWRQQAKPDSVNLPISGTVFGWLLMIVNSWPSPVGDGSMDVSIEYEVADGNSTLQDVTIIIPMPMWAPLFSPLY